MAVFCEPLRVRRLVAGEAEKVGTAFAVGPRRLVTARHVVANLPAEELSLVLPSRPNDRWEVVYIIKSEDKHDVAVLHLAKPLPVESRASPAIRVLEAAERGEAVVYGFPDVREDNRSSDLRTATGTVVGPASEEEVLALDKLSEIQRWQGASGSAIWVGGKIVGVVTVHDRDATQLIGVPIQRFWFAPWFVKAIYDPDVAFQSGLRAEEARVIAAIKGALEARPTLRGALSGHLDTEDTISALTDALLHRPASEVVEAMHATDEGEGLAPDDKAALRRLFIELLPYLGDWRKTLEGRRRELLGPEPTFKVRYGDEAMAEVLVAGALGRPTLFHVDGKNVVGPGMVVFPNMGDLPLASCSAYTVEAVARHLAHRLGVDTDRADFIDEVGQQLTRLADRTRKRLSKATPTPPTHSEKTAPYLVVAELRARSTGTGDLWQLAESFRGKGFKDLVLVRLECEGEERRAEQSFATPLKQLVKP